MRHPLSELHLLCLLQSRAWYWRILQKMRISYNVTNQSAAESTNVLQRFLMPTALSCLLWQDKLSPNFVDNLLFFVYFGDPPFFCKILQYQALSSNRHRKCIWWGCLIHIQCSCYDQPSPEPVYTEGLDSEKNRTICTNGVASLYNTATVLLQFGHCLCKIINNYVTESTR